MRIEIINDAAATLGEGPAWDVKTQTLYWIDILEKRVHYHREDEDSFIQLDEMPACLAPCKDGSLILALSGDTKKGQDEEPVDKRNRFASLELVSANLTTLASIIEPANNRFNNGKCEPSGRFLAGSMNTGMRKPPAVRSTRSKGNLSRAC